MLLMSEVDGSTALRQRLTVENDLSRQTALPLAHLLKQAPGVGLVALIPNFACMSLALFLSS